MINDEDNIDESSLSEVKTYSETIDNRKYEIIIGIINNSKQKNNIYINCILQNVSSNSIEYILIISLESLISKSNKMFSNCSTIKEAFDNIIYIFNIKIIIEEYI